MTTDTARRLTAAGVACLAATLLVGCGRRVDDEWTRQRPQVYPATGVVFYQNKPVAGATVMYESTDAGTKPGGGLVAIGHTNSAGMFRMKTYKEYEGAVAGSHRVSVTKMDYIPAKRPAGVDPNVDIPPIATSVLPEKYKDFATSGLTASVTPKGPNQIRLDLE
jgi:hypothetical protein